MESTAKMAVKRDITVCQMIRIFIFFHQESCSRKNIFNRYYGYSPSIQVVQFSWKVILIEIL